MKSIYIATAIFTLVLTSCNASGGNKSIFPVDHQEETHQEKH